MQGPHFESSLFCVQMASLYSNRDLTPGKDGEPSRVLSAGGGSIQVSLDLVSRFSPVTIDIVNIVIFHINIKK